MGFSTSILSQNSKKLKGDPLGKNCFPKKSLTMPKNLKGGPFGIFNIHSVAKHQKIEVGKIFYFLEKISQCRKTKKKTERGTLWDFPTSILSQNSKKLKRDPLGKNCFPKKSLAVPKKIERGDPLVSPGMVCYAGK